EAELSQREPSPMTAGSAPTSASSSSSTRISSMVPAMGEGISVSTLSVETSSSGSSTSTVSPTDFSQRVTVPSVTDSPSAGIFTVSDMGFSSWESSGVGVQRLAGERECGLAQRLVLRGMAVDEGGDVLGVGLPVDDEQRLAHQLRGARADHVDADDRAVLLADQLDAAGGAEDLGLAVAAQVVLVHLDRVGAQLLLGLLLGQPHGAELGLAVGDALDAGLDDRGGVQARDPLGDEDALRETAVGELEAGDDVADGVDARHAGLQGLRLSEHDAAAHLDALLLVAEAGGVRAAADGDQQVVALEDLAVGEGDLDA